MTEQTPGVEDFCRALLNALVERGDRKITIGDRDIERALPHVLRLLWDEADRRYRSDDKQTSFWLLEIIEDLSPDPNTGVFDGFWSAVNQLQPFVVSIVNPAFKEAKLNIPEAMASENLNKLSPILQQLSRRSAALITGSHAEA